MEESENIVDLHLIQFKDLTSVETLNAKKKSTPVLLKDSLSQKNWKSLKFYRIVAKNLRNPVLKWKELVLM